MGVLLVWVERMYLFRPNMISPYPDGITKRSQFYHKMNFLLRQLKRKRGPFAHRAFHGNLVPVEFKDAVGDGKPKA